MVWILGGTEHPPCFNFRVSAPGTHDQQRTA